MYFVLFKEKDLSDIVITPVVPEGYSHIYNQYVILVKNRDLLREHLKNNEVTSEIYYPVPLHLQECFANLGYREGDFPVCE
ncbi:unnamed protein product, partial [marine sediment metagenome]